MTGYTQSKKKIIFLTKKIFKIEIDNMKQIYQNDKSERIFKGCETVFSGEKKMDEKNQEKVNNRFEKKNLKYIYFSGHLRVKKLKIFSEYFSTVEKVPKTLW
jgi:hypothetical protein